MHKGSQSRTNQYASTAHKQRQAEFAEQHKQKLEQHSKMVAEIVSPFNGVVMKNGLSAETLAAKTLDYIQKNGVDLQMARPVVQTILHNDLRGSGCAVYKNNN